MANKKISQLPAGSTVGGTDLLPVVHDPSGSPVTQKFTVAQILQSIAASGNYGVGNQPSFTPVGSLGFAVNLDDGRFWMYYGGAWH